jgi:DNA-binding transcriptional regulator PaaX
VLRRFEAGTLDDEECFATRLRSLIDFVTINLKDPALPFSLLPDNWPRSSARSLFKELQHALTGPAERFFDAIYQTKGATDDKRTQL